MMKRMFAAGAAAMVMLWAGGALAQDAEDPPFTEFAAFGDSLSDAGNLAISIGLPPLSFTTNPGQVGVELIAAHYGFNGGPSLAGGGSYAYGGAGLIHNAPGTPPAPTITAQVNSYLAANAELDPNGLYSFWGGANDIFWYVDQVSKGQVTPTAAVQAMSATAGQAIALINQLQQAGAGTILVFNLPDTGATPSAIFAEQFVPGTRQLLTSMAVNYNLTLDQGMAGRHGIAPVNVFALVNEVRANPGAYGLVNITTPACTVASSLTCTPGTLVAPNADQTYLFADGVHPTTKAHQLLADAVIAELSAPRQMSVLAETPLALGFSRNLIVGQQLRDASARPGEGVTIFASGGWNTSNLDAQFDLPSSDADGFNATIGGRTTVSEGMTVGLALTLAQDQLDFDGAAGGFDMTGLMLSAFLQYDFGEGAYVNATGHLMHVQFNDIERAFDIGPARRVETSETEGSGLGARIGGGYWFGGEGWRTGPFAAIDYQRVNVDAFREDGSSATAMTFGDQDRDYLAGELGWAIEGTVDMGGSALRPYASVAVAHDTQAGEDRRVTAGLVTLNGTFDMPAFVPEETWAQVNAGVSADFGERWGGHLGYSGRFGDDSREWHGVVVGLHSRF
jgi:outer membrane lipase/esterase